MKRALELLEEVKKLPDDELGVFYGLFRKYMQEKEEERMLASLEADFEACRKEYEDAPKLSDEEIDKIIKDVRRQNRRTSEASTT
ncbi:hypothetical protein [Cohnella thermotolerans]|uniref:hypothetical protein n=1 Tax=Cohnella thermotolerans TaxID=329858 RepID=UPI00040B0D26|nr:hypothetical protein [Cohnella thermotolerans]